MKKFLFFILAVLSLNAFATSVTFEVSMKGSGVEYDSVFVVGSHSDWNFIQMEDQGDSLFSVTMNIPANDTAVYYFITIGYWASDYLDYREIVPAECDFSEEIAGWTGDRAFVVGSEPITAAYVWSTCDEPVVEGPDFLKQNLMAQKDVVCYPNPAEEFINVSFADKSAISSVHITDITGRLVYSADINAKQTLVDVTGINPGIYMLQVYSGSEVSAQQIIIK